MADAIELAVGLIKENEGFRGFTYRDSYGNPTIGYGTKEPLTQAEAGALLRKRLVEFAERDCRVVFDNWRGIAPERKAALLDMAYNLGFYRLSKFKRMIAAVKREDWEQAAHEVLWNDIEAAEPTAYAKQTGARARANSRILRGGEAGWKHNHGVNTGTAQRSGDTP